ncbi:MAG: hypothetical protein QHH04_05125 [Methanolinea sp.]|jgi:hypothetical protein|nr:hypothetical protein [Methanolinea sp.]
MTLSSPFSSDDIIFAYTRADALRDGVLVELPGDLCKNAGIVVSVAVTRAIWDEYISPEYLSELADQDVPGRIWDLLWMFSCAARQSRQTSIVFFKIEFAILDNANRARSSRTLATFKAICGPGDEGEPVITIMLPEED